MAGCYALYYGLFDGFYNPSRAALGLSAKLVGTGFAVTRRVLERLGQYTLVECRLETGRIHQIRVHMAHLHHPILGDTVYGNPRPELGQDSQCLHARALTFRHPRTGEEVTVTCPRPAYFEAVLEKLRKSNK